MNENVGLAKKLFFGERVSGEIRMDFFNIFNRFRACTPDETVTDGNFGLINGGTGPCQGNTQRQGEAYFRIQF